MKWDEEFRKYLKELDTKKPVVLTGDLNVAHEEIGIILLTFVSIFILNYFLISAQFYDYLFLDIANPKTNTKSAGFTKEERNNMSLLLEQGFIDTFRTLNPEKTGAYTFWTYFHNARAKNVGW